ncbi:WD repeat protein [Ichthyophthirius multifiliis]|uniref:WD repeat protein n=1 Tax=Ichthyophthirius multifiliis TaxID=5932 RepID=G0R279_ICHMU|nr:WD repeat protein [Ichthyophthirius multifiliis]EGR28426.1 WD repeat protein [Ichthyophthirius multifiliis]|eukprot:XP_004029662.1 WD repeat protein [Ichthyophthirius multifiliis]
MQKQQKVTEEVSEFENEESKNQFVLQVKKRNETHVKYIRKYLKLKENDNILDFYIPLSINQYFIKNHLQFLGQQHIIFNVSNLIAIKNIQNKEYIFLQKEGHFKHISCIQSGILENQSKDIINKSIIVIGENIGEQKNAIITLIIKNKWSFWKFDQIGIIKEIYINTENQYIASQVCLQSQNLIYLYSYRKGKILAEMNIKMDNISLSINPQKPTKLIISSNCYLKQWEVFFQKKCFKESVNLLLPVKVQNENNFIMHTWSSGNFLVPKLIVLAQGNILFIFQNEFLQQKVNLNNSLLNFQIINSEEFNEILDIDKQKNLFQKENVNFCCLTSIKNGFILGSDNYGCLSIFECEEKQNNTIKNLMNFQIKINGFMNLKILQIQSCCKDNNILIISQRNNLLNFHLFNPYQIDSELSPIQPFINLGFHRKRIHKLTTCISKNIFASCSADFTVRIWNYFDIQNNDKYNIVTQCFSEEPLNISLHPSGLFLAVGFSNYFIIFAIFKSSLKFLKKIQAENCSILEYANGGHFLVSNKNNLVIIFDTINYDPQQVLEGHPAQIKHICITKCDQYIISLSLNGCIFQWNILEPQNNTQRTYEHIDSFVYTTFYFEYMQTSDNQLPINDIFIGFSTYKYFVIYKQKWKQLIAEFVVEDNIYVTCCVVSNQLKSMFLGLSGGQIRHYLWPLDEDMMKYEILDKNSGKVKLLQPDYIEIQVHQFAVSSLIISADNKMLISGDEGGCLWILSIKDFSLDDKGKYLNNKNQINDYFFEELNNVLNFREVIEKQEEEIKNIEKICDDQRIKSDKKYIEIKKNKVIQEENIIKKIQEEMEVLEINEQKKYLELKNILKKEKEKKERENEEKKQNFQTQIEFEQKKNIFLNQKITENQEKNINSLKQIENLHLIEMEQIKEEFFQKTYEIQEKIQKIKKCFNNLDEINLQQIENLENEFEKEIESKMKQLKLEIFKIKQKNIALCNQNQNLSQFYDELEIKDKNYCEELQNLKKKHEQLKVENIKNDQNILKLQHQLLERLQVIDYKDENCKNAKDEQINLENFRYMLKQKETKLQIQKGNLQEKVKNKHNLAKNMLQELLQESKKNEKFKIELKKINNDVFFVEKNIISNEEKVNSYFEKFKAFHFVLLDILKGKDTIQVVSRKLNEILNDKINFRNQKQYVDLDFVLNNTFNDNKLNLQLAQQTKFTHNQITNVEKIFHQIKFNNQQEYQIIYAENNNLIKECNFLRVFNDKLRKELTFLQKKYQECLRNKENSTQKNQAFLTQ